MNIHVGQEVMIKNAYGIARVENIRIHTPNDIELNVGYPNIIKRMISYLGRKAVVTRDLGDIVFLNIDNEAHSWSKKWLIPIGDIIKKETNNTKKRKAKFTRLGIKA